MKRYLIAALAALVLCSCAKTYEPGASFTSTEGLVCGSSTVMAYESSSWQYSVTVPKKGSGVVYKVCADDMSSWYRATCSKAPSNEGQKVVVDLTWSVGGKKSVRNDIDCTVERMSDGVAWLWAGKENLGFTVCLEQ